MRQHRFISMLIGKSMVMLSSASDGPIVRVATPTPYTDVKAAGNRQVFPI